VRVAWDVPDLKPHGPDIAVIFGVSQRRVWGTFSVAEEGARPALIIEVTSPETRRTDLYDKLIEDDQAGVAPYIIIDIHQRQGVPTIRLLGYRATPSGYVGFSLDERGRLWLDPVGVWLGIEAGRVMCYDADGIPIDDYSGVAAALAIETQARAEAE